MFFPIDVRSFLLGVFTASVFWWLMARARPLWSEARQYLRERREAAQSRRSSGAEENHRRLTLRRAQGMHLAASLFALDEILQEPLILAPPAVIIPGGPPVSEDVVTQTLPYLPAWPELAAAYNSPTLTITEALQGGRNLILTGQPGMGKTVTLAHLASLAANRSEKLGPLQDHLPLLIHVADLRLPADDEKDVLKPIIEVHDAYAPVFDLGRLANLIQQAFRGGRALLLLDGYDELAAQGQKAVSDFLAVLLSAYPQTRVVITGALDNLGGLPALGFVPLAVAAWNRGRRTAFVNRWGELWAQFVSLEAWAQTGAAQVDPLLLNRWLDVGEPGLTPLELTLRVWAAYAGDAVGPGVLDAISTHIRRLAPSSTPPAALDALALQVVLSSQPVFDPRRAGAWVSKFEAPDESVPAESPQTEAEAEQPDGRSGRAKKGGRASTPPPPTYGLLSRMAGTGLLVTHLHNRMRFVHPVFEGYLAGRAMSDYSVSQGVLEQPDWTGKLMALRYLAAHGDMTRLVEQVLGWSRLPMQRPLLNAARWLRDAPADAEWRGRIMSALVQVMRSEGLPLGLRGQAAAAFVLSNDPGARSLFRQLMNTLSFDVVQLCALGSGALRDAKATQTLESVLSAPSLAARRAACLALVSIGTNESLEVVAHGLLSGDDDLRRAAAEALANDPGEGHAMLKEGAALADIMVRRAVVYGLGRVDEPWAVELLQKLQVEDQQWVVRNSAAEVLERCAEMDPRVPRLLPAPSETPWIIEFAGTQGIGISPGSPATDILTAALKSENPELRLAAIPYLKKTPSEGIIPRLYDAMYSEDAVLQEAGYLALMEIAASGIKLPNPSQFGLG